MDVVVTGIGLRSALGNLAQTWQKLLLGESGIQLQQPFPDQSAFPLGLLAETPATDLRSLTQAVVTDAIQDAGLTLPLVDCAVVVGSSRGNQTLLEQRLWEDMHGPDWWAALPNVAAVTTAQILQTQAIVLAPMAACATGITTLARGAELIDAGQCDRVIAGAVDTPVTRLTLAGFAKMGALAKTGAYPFDRAREGFVLGEGGAVLVLESRASAQARGVRIYGRLMGAGLSADAYHISSPNPLGTGAQRVMQQALAIAGLKPGEIDYIHAHGTATKLNDAMEARIIYQLFGDDDGASAAQSRPWVSSTKGATGHTLGGSSALGAAVCLMALKNQVVPGCVGLRQHDLPIQIAHQTVLTKLRYAICNGFGFGGQNGAIVFGPADMN
ncbi:beta-ketoacyl-ACP synthase [filamentous cyanobacterium LEGE 11480]|uniref:Beta-ketoacyl-ACP synthase n=1 Tax=Romeriopsis navalis LEGE 11480 TaxID=2777977 RepID=A0A928VSU7_9CYAN|nr:beta-ketoacyl-ACP synthase [Romeriopsis navalis]MBE9033098.1 beta-ketoacyl-ACP synthase [Romeriopsis navalis LEGE 11480]